MNSQTLYQRVLGKDFDKLPSVLQRFHSQPQGGCATGTIVVERSVGILGHMVAGVLRLPKAGEKIQLRLQVTPQDDKEVWIRYFDHQCLKTLQWQEGPYLVEKAGPLCLVFQLVADADGLTFHLQHNKTRSIQLPTGMSLCVHAKARGAAEQWHIAVTIAVPLLGKITTYQGEIVPHSC